MILKKKRKVQTNHPDLSKLRPVLFWDTNMEKINWEKQKRAVIKRIFERGNDIEKKEIVRFYGRERVDDVLLSNVK